MTQIDVEQLVDLPIQYLDVRRAMVYVSGPYRAVTRNAVAKNVQAAYDAATVVWEMGAAVICPHKNTEDMEGVIELVQLLAGDFEMVRRSDAVLMLNGWANSLGAKLERDVAIREKVPLFYQEVPDWQEHLQQHILQENHRLQGGGLR